MSPATADAFMDRAGGGRHGGERLRIAGQARALNPAAARAVLTPDRYAEIEVHNWDFGGRR
jgi:hypothetical protein